MPMQYQYYKIKMYIFSSNWLGYISSILGSQNYEIWK